ncbi:hybrid sensor histidine kinase/response regulator [Microvirga splendida]|uniref:histidine kinase n=1 Tax=Microvirga splendida TaxID=2795727 RepID=A0ABS0Y522_9HYPH|nr:PAS domain-containing sensor histidine kinase [Microvirga splendida]MBJ6127025.1 PAS domain S-box protein [Microvirga splendida]
MHQLEDELLSSVFDAVDTGLIVLDGSMRVVAWNAWFVSASGIASQDAVGRQLDELFPGAVSPGLRSAITDTLEAGSSRLLTHSLHPFVLPLQTRSGRQLIHNVSVRPLGTRPDLRCLVQIVDVTVAVQREQVLRERQNARYDAVVNSAPDAILTLDSQGVIQLANPAAASEFGYALRELVGMQMAALLNVPETWNELWTSLLEGTVMHRSVEVTARRKDGSVSFLEVSAARWQSDMRVFVTFILRNVNERRAAEEALRDLNQTLEERVDERTQELLRAEEQLRQAQKMEAVGQLTGGIAHDFNNLLAGIVGSLDLMQTRIAQGRTEHVERYAKAAMSSAQRAAALTHRLLAFARRQPLDPKPVNANQLIASMEDLLRRTIGPMHALEIVTAGGLWTTLCDPNQLESAILNLAINARDAMPEGGKLTIETANAHLDDAYGAAHIDVTPGQYVSICITDTGAGMTPDVVERVFEPFFTTKPIGQGTGLGLSMVYGFAKQSEGHVKIYSEVGQGTTIRIYLPRHRGVAQEEPSTISPAEMSRAEAGETVLVVEDEPVIRNLIVEVLQELGYRALEASDGPAGLKVLQSGQRIDLLVTDVGLPGINGRQIADAARETRPGLKVLFITGYAENATLANGFLDPGMEMITKPFAVEALATRITRMIQGAR